MNRFNLTFSGEIVEGQDPELVKLRFANKFAIDDPVRLERFFSGQTVILRRNLERKDAAQVYHELQLLGVVAALVKVPDTELAEETSQPPSTKSSSAESTNATKKRTVNAASRLSENAAVNHSAKETVAPTASAHWPDSSRDIAAEIKARKLAAQRLAAEKAALEQAALDARQRELAAAAAREQALAAERQRVADEERARQAAEQARVAAEEAERKAAEQAQIKRLEAEEIARKTAIKAAAKRKAAEEAAQRRAKRNRDKAEKARRKAVEEAQRQVELAEKKRLAAEEEARRKAALEEKKRRAAEAEARRKAEVEENKRQAAEAEARRKAEAEEKKRLAAAEEARRRAEAEERKRLAAEEARRKAAAEAEEDARLQAELEAIKQREAQEAARLQAELEEKARQAAAQAARIKAEAQRLQEEAQRKSDERRRIAAEALSTQQSAEQRLAEQQLTEQQQETLTQHTVAEASPPPLSPVRLQTLKPAKSRVKTALEVPLRKKGETPEIGVPGQRKRVSGEPNLYKLRPFRNTEAVRTRAAHARARMRRAATTAVLALGVLLIAAGSFLQHADNAAITGATAIAINANSEPLLLAGDVLLLHDRAGVGTTEIALNTLGVSVLEPPLEFDGEDVLFARGRLAGDAADTAQDNALQVLRCDLVLSRCAPLSTQLQDSRIDAFVLNPVDGSVLLADRTAGQLLKVDRAGAVVARAAVAIPDAPVMRLHDGLLLMNSTAGPGISVFRYEEKAFAKQLDEILPLPSSELDLERARAGDFVWSGDAWWVYLRATESAPGALHRFDDEWNYRSTVTLPADAGPWQPGAVQLVNWGEKTLVNDSSNPTIQRYNAQGMAEAAFASTSLQALVSAGQQRAGFARIAWHGGLLLCSLVAVLGCALAYWHGLRNLVYRPRREQGALPLDDLAAALRWIEPVQNRQEQLRSTGIRYGLGALAALSLAIAMSVSVSQLAALLLACSGPAIALQLLRRQPTGYIGVLADKLLLVDHNGMYQLAGGSRLQYRGPFLAIDDIVVFAGSQRLPAFSLAALQQHVWPLALGGIKVDRKTMAVKLLECRHPLALGAVAIVATAAAAALLLLVPHIF
ncbi:MAG: hypothetical protein IPG06_23615 [Haliea sp.]|nr:hypothetical protein [Haliea sp.]